MIDLKMPALSPTMEEGTIAKWLVRQGDTVKAGDILAEIETDKATMEYEAVDEGTIVQILVPEGSDGVKVGAIIATISEDGEHRDEMSVPAEAHILSETETRIEPPALPEIPPNIARFSIGRDQRTIDATPLSRKLAEALGLDLATVAGSGANGRIRRCDLKPVPSPALPAPLVSRNEVGDPQVAVVLPQAVVVPDVPHQTVKLTSMRKAIAQRLTVSKQQIPHIYLTVELDLDELQSLRMELNAALHDAGVRISVNDMLIKGLALALTEVPECNVMIAGEDLVRFLRADISVAVSVPDGLITPIVAGAGKLSISAITKAMKDLAVRARDGKLVSHEYRGGTATLSNLGMFGIKQFQAVINPPQAMIMAIGAGEKRVAVRSGNPSLATTLFATGSFDHRAIDGADAARLMMAFKRILENPLELIA